MTDFLIILRLVGLVRWRSRDHPNEDPDDAASARYIMEHDRWRESLRRKILLMQGYFVRSS